MTRKPNTNIRFKTKDKFKKLTKCTNNRIKTFTVQASLLFWYTHIIDYRVHGFSSLGIKFWHQNPDSIVCLVFKILIYWIPFNRGLVNRIKFLALILNKTLNFVINSIVNRRWKRYLLWYWYKGYNRTFLSSVSFFAFFLFFVFNMHSYKLQ